MADITSIGNNMLGETEYRYENWIDPFLIGHWEIKDSPEIWSAYSVFAIYSDGYEAGISYRLTGDSLFTGMGDVNIIEKLTETELLPARRMTVFVIIGLEPFGNNRFGH